MAGLSEVSSTTAAREAQLALQEEPRHRHADDDEEHEDLAETAAGVLLGRGDERHMRLVYYA